MPFQLSPGVAVVEKDFSSIVPAVSSSAGAFAGPFAWGPIEDPVRISSETELVSRFGAPTRSNYSSFFTAANFLAYTNSLYVSRADAPLLRNAVAIKSGSLAQADIQLVSAGSGYAAGTPGEVPLVTISAPNIPGGIQAIAAVTYTDTTVSSVTTRAITGINLTNVGSGYTVPPTITIASPASGTAATARFTRLTTSGIKIKNITNYLSAFVDGAGVCGPFAAKFAGEKANGIRTVILDKGNFASAPANIRALFTNEPGTSTFAARNMITNDEVHIVILDNAYGDFSGQAGSVLEKYSFLSKLSDAKKTDGSNNFYKNVINSQSKYVWWMDHPGAATLSENSISAVNAVGGSAMVISSSSKTITIVASGSFANLETFKTFFDAAPDKDRTSTTANGITSHGRQINISGTNANNAVFTVVSVARLTADGATSGYVITVLEAPTQETVTTGGIITSVAKPTWGLSSSLVKSTSPNAYTLALAKTQIDYTLSGGVDDFESTAGNVQTAYAIFSNTDQYDISLIPVGNVSAATAKFIVDNIAEVRKDCVVFVSPRNEDGSAITSVGATATDAIVAYRDASNLDTSYAVMDSGYKYQYDRYNDAYWYIPLNGDIAGLCARTDYTADPWFSPGGFNRGQIKNIVKLAFNPSQPDRDILYSKGVNPVVSFPGQGTILYGDKTMQRKPSAFDRINVRRLFIVLEKSIATAAKFQMFEFNDTFSRAQFRNLVEPFLRDVQGRRGVTDFRVKCDETNNTGQVIDSNEFVADIFIKPNRSINFITLNFIAARSSVSFEEIGA